MPFDSVKNNEMLPQNFRFAAVCLHDRPPSVQVLPAALHLLIALRMHKEELAGGEQDRDRRDADQNLPGLHMLDDQMARDSKEQHLDHGIEIITCTNN